MRSLLSWFRSGSRPIHLLAGTLLVLSLGGLYIAHPPFLQFLDFKLYDLLLRGQPAKPTAERVVIVDLDERSLAEYGQWPWPRYRLALLMERIRQQGALSIGLDILLAEPDRTSPAVLRREFKRDLGLDVEFSGLPEALEDNDALLARILGSGPYVLSFYFDFSDFGQSEQVSASSLGLPTLGLSIAKADGASEPEATMLRPSKIIAPLPELAQATRHCGFYNTLTDLDGTIRRTPLLIAHQGKYYPSLALAVILEALNGGTPLLKVGQLGPEGLRVAKGLNVPLDPQGSLLVNYRGPAHSFPHISAADVLAGTASADAFSGKIVLVGTSAAGLQDLRTTPFGPGYPGVEVHANVVDSILQQDFILRPDWAPGVELAILLFTGLGTVLLMTCIASKYMILPLGLLGWAIWLGSERLLAIKGMYISPLYSYLSFGSSFVLLTFLKFMHEERQRRFLHTAFSRYVAPAVVSRIVNSPKSLSLQGEEKEVTILFSDIRSFTSLSEKLSPTQVSELLRAYLTPMTRIITDELGTLDKFIGDAIMAFWNAPLDVQNHPARAMRAAQRMLAELDTLNREFEQRFGLRLSIGIGVHTATVRVGNMGSDDLFDYTVIGDGVNYASRLEGLTKFYGAPLVCSAEVALRCQGSFAFQELDKVRVKGKQNATTIFTAMSGDSGGQAQERELHARGIGLYQARDFTAAAESFTTLARLQPEKRIYQIYLERCCSLARQDVPEDWDGVFIHTEK
ncbi:adenylate/guanylate cyclase domain-containing protein [Desulfocurvibacter africanus]|uniref:CHASE2 domain-containing protein n=1 Tax=Desulfocurvibacter africanus TaxID=873 RepID=UPI002FDA625A